MDTSKQDRAKQFMAFEALTGLKEVFEEKEHECEAKITKQKYCVKNLELNIII